MNKRISEWKCSYCKSFNTGLNKYCTKCNLYDKNQIYHYQLSHCDPLYIKYIKQYLKFSPSIWAEIISYIEPDGSENLNVGLLYDKKEFFTDNFDRVAEENEYHSSFYKEPYHYKIGDYVRFKDKKGHLVGKILSFYSSGGKYYMNVSKLLRRKDLPVLPPHRIRCDSRWCRWIDVNEIDNYELIIPEPKLKAKISTNVVVNKCKVLPYNKYLETLLVQTTYEDVIKLYYTRCQFYTPTGTLNTLHGLAVESSNYNYFPHRASRVGPRFQAFVTAYDPSIKLNDEEVKQMELIYEPNDDLDQEKVSKYLADSLSKDISEDIAYNILFSNGYDFEKAHNYIDSLPEKFSPEYYETIVHKELLDKPVVFSEEEYLRTVTKRKCRSYDQLTMQWGKSILHDFRRSRTKRQKRNEIVRQILESEVCDKEGEGEEDDEEGDIGEDVAEEEEIDNECEICHCPGNLIKCSGNCEKYFHKDCLGDDTIDNTSTWYCDKCKSLFNPHDNSNIELAINLMKSKGECPVLNCDQSRKSRKGISWHISQSHTIENTVLTNIFQLACNLNMVVDISSKSICSNILDDLTCPVFVCKNKFNRLLALRWHCIAIHHIKFQDEEDVRRENMKMEIENEVENDDIKKEDIVEGEEEEQMNVNEATNEDIENNKNNELMKPERDNSQQISLTSSSPANSIESIEKENDEKKNDENTHSVRKVYKCPIMSCYIQFSSFKDCEDHILNTHYLVLRN